MGLLGEIWSDMVAVEEPNAEGGIVVVVETNENLHPTEFFAWEMRCKKEQCVRLNEGFWHVSTGRSMRCHVRARMGLACPGEAASAGTSQGNDAQNGFHVATLPQANAIHHSRTTMLSRFNDIRQPPRRSIRVRELASLAQAINDPGSVAPSRRLGRT